MTRLGRSMVRKIALAALVTLAPAVCYIPAGRFDLVWDDRELVLNSPVVTGHMPVWRVFGQDFWIEHDLSKGDAYRPLVKLSYALSLSSGAGGFHLHNVGMHCANGLLLYGLLLVCGCACGPAALAALVATCHPLQSEAVAYVKNRSELMCVGFVLLSLLSGVYSGRSRSARGAGLWAMGSVLAYAGALLCRSTAVVYFPLVVGCAWFVAGKWRWLSSAGYAAMLVLYFAVRPPSDTQFVMASAGDAVSRLASYGRLVLLPVCQSAHHVAGAHAAWAWLAALAAAAALGHALATRRAWALAAGAAGVLALAPALLGPFALRPIAEQRAYAACAAMAVLVLPSLAGPRRRRLLAALIAVLCCLTVHRAFAWQSEARLWRDTVLQSGLQARPLTNFGLTLKQAARYRPALWAFEKAAALDARDINPLYNAGACHMDLKQWDQAAACFEKAIALEPRGLLYARLALARVHSGRMEAALQAARRGVELSPQSRLVREVMAFVEARRPAGAGRDTKREE